MSLARGAQQVGAPDKQVAREVLRIVRVLAGKFERAGLHLFHRILHRVHAHGFRRLGDFQRIGFQLRTGRQPAHALGAHVEVDQPVVAVALVGGGREDLGGGEFLVAPLAGVGVEEGRRVHVARRTMPVQRKGQRRPAGLRAQLFLAHVMRPAAAGLADAAAHHQHVHDAAVDHVVVVPVVQRRAEDDHGLAVGLVGVIGEFARHGDDVGARHAAMCFSAQAGV